MSASSGVTRRVLLPSLLLSALVGGLAVLAQLAWIVADERRAVDEQSETIRDTVIPSLEEALWGINDAQVDAILQGLVQHPLVGRVLLVDEEGRGRAFGEPTPGILEQRRFPLSYRKAGGHRLGELTVDLSDAPLKARLLRRGLGTTLALGLALAATGIAGALMFRRRIGTPLAEVTRRIERFSVRGTGADEDLPPVEGASPDDEIGRLDAALRTMRRQVRRDVREIERLRDEIAAHARGLEGLVRERTAELELRNAELARQRDAIEALANTDALTGALSRRHFLELAERERARAARNGRGLAVLLLDIDHFKRVNDTHGHAGGDAVLRQFRATCAAELRTTDLLGRLGGEEFAVVLDAPDREALLAAAERIRAAVARSPVILPSGETQAVTVSIGAAMADAAGTTVDGLLAMADEALYAAKRGGRDRVVLAAGA